MRRLYVQLERWEQIQRREDRRAGLVAASVFNANPFRGRGPAVLPDDFFPK